MTQSALAGLLSAWLPAQRWFAGSGASVRQVEITSDIALTAGDPELRHVLADVWVGQEQVCYQVPVGVRHELPPPLCGSVIGRLPDGRIAYDAAGDPELMAVLMHGITTGRREGPLRFAAEPDAAIDETAPARPLPAVASNTSIVFGDRAIMKLLRRPFAGHHPDLEVPATLARGGSRLVAAPLGWIEITGGGQSQPVDGTTAAAAGGAGRRVADGTGEPAVLAIVSEFFPHSTDGWSLATASLRDADPDFAPQARLLGEATARLHAEMAAAFGVSVLPRHAVGDLIAAMSTELTRAITVVPQLREHERAIRACYASLAAPDTEIGVQRIHGDYHLAQVLGTEGPANGGDDLPRSLRRWIVLDFEGEPSVPLAIRRAFAPPLRDVAGMLRSFDYAGRHQALAHPGDERLARAAADWVRQCQDAFCAGYAEQAGADPRRSGPLLRALTLQKAVYEAVYEARHRPAWLPIPLGAIAEASTEASDASPS